MLNCQVLDFTMKALNNRNRKIRVFTPKDYQTTKKYPVIYMHDGQNLFDDETASYGKSWNIANLFNDLNIDIIVVGIDSGEELLRLDELGPWKNEWLKAENRYNFITRTCGGESDKYFQFIIEELKPWVDANYSTLETREHTCIAGSSMGGLVSLYGVLKYPEIFSKAACLSSAFWFSEEELIQFIRSYQSNIDLKIYLDFGGKESEDIGENEYLVNLNEIIHYKLTTKGIKSIFKLDVKGYHNEASWERRFPDAIKYLFNELIGKRLSI